MAIISTVDVAWERQAPTADASPGSLSRTGLYERSCDGLTWNKQSLCHKNVRRTWELVVIVHAWFAGGAARRWRAQHFWKHRVRLVVR